MLAAVGNVAVMVVEKCGVVTIAREMVGWKNGKGGHDSGEILVVENSASETIPSSGIVVVMKKCMVKCSGWT